MPPTTTDETPPALKPFTAHGVTLRENPGTGQAQGECPFCAGEKFHVNVKTGLWDCKNCASEGNPVTFLRKFWESLNLPDDRADWLLGRRGLLDPATFAEWGVRFNPLTDEIVVPGFGTGGKLDQLYRYVRLPGKDKYVLIATPKGVEGADDAMTHGLFGMQHYDPKKPYLYLCEGPWDGMVLWETLRNVKEFGGKLEQTGSESASLLAECNVLAVPGANVFPELWLPLFAGKHVALVYDNDHRRTNPKAGVEVDGAGVAGMRKACQLFSRYEEPPASVKCIYWGNGAVVNEELDNGYDLRDWLTQDGNDTFVDRATSWVNLRDTSLLPFPEDWLIGRSAKTIAAGGVKLDIEECTSWKEFRNAGKTAFQWTEGMNAAAAVVFASILSTETAGDQIWVKMVGPPSSGKTELCEAVSTNEKYVRAVSKFKGFHSGYLVEKGGKTDVSLLHQVRNKTMVIKDGDTFLKLPNLPEVMAEMRDIYDRMSRSSYKTGVNRVYKGVNLTVVLAGTSSLRELDSSELGERFLDVVIMDEIDEDLEMDITLRAIYQAERDLKIKADGKLETQDSPEKVKFKRLAGGYVSYLRENREVILADIHTPPGVYQSIYLLAKFVSFCRCRPSKKQDEKVERELSARLGRQLFRLAHCLAGVFNKKEVDAEVLALVRKVAMDTSRGKTLDIARVLVTDGGDNGLDTSEIAARTLRPEEKERGYLNFLRALKVVKRRKTVLGGGVKPSTKWVLTESFHDLYTKVMNG